MNNEPEQQEPRMKPARDRRKGGNLNFKEMPCPKCAAVRV